MALKTLCQRTPGYCSHDPLCADTNCPGHPRNGWPLEHNEGPGILASPLFWLIIVIELGGLAWWCLA